MPAPQVNPCRPTDHLGCGLTPSGPIETADAPTIAAATSTRIHGHPPRQPFAPCPGPGRATGRRMTSIPSATTAPTVESARPIPNPDGR